MEVKSLRELVAQRLEEGLGTGHGVDTNDVLVDLVDHYALKQLLSIVRAGAELDETSRSLVAYLGRGDPTEVDRRTVVFSRAAFLTDGELNELRTVVADEDATASSGEPPDYREHRSIVAHAIEVETASKFLSLYVRSEASSLERTIIFARIKSTGVQIELDTAKGKELGSIFTRLQSRHRERGQTSLSSITETAVAIAEFFAHMKAPELTATRRKAFELLERPETWIELGDDPLQSFARYQVGSAAFLCADNPALDDRDRLWLIRVARDQMRKAVESDESLIVVAPMLIGLCLLEARMLGSSDPDLEAVRALAADMMSRAVGVSDEDLRLAVISGISLAIPQIDHLQARYESAVSSARTAKVFAERWLEHAARVYREEMKSITQMEADASDEDAVHLRQIKREVETILSVPVALGLLCEHIEVTSRAELARRQGDLKAVGDLLEEAIAIRERARTRFVEMLAMVMPALFQPSVDADPQQDTAGTFRIYQLRAMVELSRADELVFEGHLADALQSLERCETLLVEAAALVDRHAQQIRSTLSPIDDSQRRRQNDALRRVVDWVAENESRRRYIEAKRSLVRATHLSSLHQHYESAKAFQAVGLAFEAMAEDSGLLTSSKLSRVFWASAQYCEGCFDAELCLHDLEQGSFRDLPQFEAGLARLSIASAEFEAADEIHWAAFLRGMRLEYEVLAYDIVARRGGDSQGLARQTSLGRAREARLVYREYGFAHRERALSSWITSTEAAKRVVFEIMPSTLPLPLAVSTQDSDNPIDTAKRGTEVNMEVEAAIKGLQKAQARVGALERRLVDLRERRDSGRIDEGRYVDLAASLETEMFELMQEVKLILRDDQALGNVVASISSAEGSPENRKELEVAIERTGDKLLLDRIRSGGELLLRLVIESGIRVLSQQV